MSIAELLPDRGVHYYPHTLRWRFVSRNRAGKLVFCKKVMQVVDLNVVKTWFATEEEYMVDKLVE